MIRYLSVCSGIEAASVAWKPMGWEPVAFSEIEPFPCAVLAHHYPTVPNWGDMTRYEEWPDADVDLLCGGTPCQSFSVAGLRKGLADPRGNLMLTYLAIAARYRPRWIVWENVVGVLSSNGGRDFGALLGGLGQLGYGFAYRVLDARHTKTSRFPRGVFQRRERAWVVGYLGDWRRSAAVLFDRESLSGDYSSSISRGFPTLCATMERKWGSNQWVRGGFCILRDGRPSRITPIEAERLTGFPDNYTRIPYKGRPADNCPVEPRVRAIGNSWAVNCAEWIGERINEIDSWEIAA